MNYEQKYIKYKNKYLLLKNKLNKQVGGSQYFIVDSKDETLKEQKTFPYNDINFKLLSAISKSMQASGD